jgi:hypothetical protein
MDKRNGYTLKLGYLLFFPFLLCVGCEFMIVYDGRGKHTDFGLVDPVADSPSLDGIASEPGCGADNKPFAGLLNVVFVVLGFMSYFASECVVNRYQLQQHMTLHT